MIEVKMSVAEELSLVSREVLALATPPESLTTDDNSRTPAGCRRYAVARPRSDVR
jgi:hypothetical protein